MAKTLAFVYRSRRIPLFVMTAICLVPNCLAQAIQDGQEAREILRLTDDKQREFVNSVIDMEFPEGEGDKFALLLVNRSELVIPLIEERIERELKNPSRTERFVDLAAALLVYAGDEQSLRAVSKLVAIDENRFGRLVGRTLDNSMNWRNPFTVGYRAFDIGDDAIIRRTIAWSESALASDQMQRRWAEAMLDRYGKVPGQPEWSQDPIAARIRDPNASALREPVTRFAADTMAKRQQQ